jgi:hypothetical protein
LLHCCQSAESKDTEDLLGDLELATTLDRYGQLALPAAESGNGDSDGDRDGDSLSAEREGGMGDDGGAHEVTATDLPTSSHLDIPSDITVSRGEDERDSEEDGDGDSDDEDGSDSASALEDARGK